LSSGSLYHDLQTAELLEDWENVVQLRDAVVSFANNNMFYLIYLDKELVDIYINHEYLNQDLIEQAISYYLKREGILKTKPNYKWVKSKIIVQTT
jgi:hypothetical protein